MSDQNHINQQDMLRIGTILHGTYRIDRYLSSGGFGNTYVVTHVDFDETYAVKEFFMKGVTERDGNNTTVSVSNREKVTEFEVQREKFKKEARRLRKLNNPHIVHVHDLFEENGTAYYVMDYVDGENLSQRLKRTQQPLKEAEVTNIVRQVLDALQEVHSNHIWHLDLKPANIMVDDNGTVKLIDFGASKQFNRQTGGATTGTAISFTNGYAPREQMEQSYEKFGSWTDFYALGATLYTLLTNRKPPMPTDIDDDHSGDKHLALPLPLGISEKMRKLILWLMKTDRMERPQNVAEIQQFLNQIKQTTTFVSSNAKEDTIVDRQEESTPKKKPVFDYTQPKEPSVTPQKSKSKKNGKTNNNYIYVIVFYFLAAFVIGLFINNLKKEDTPTDIPAETYTNNVDDKATPSKEVVTKLSIYIPLGQCVYTGEVNEKGIPDGNGEAWFEDGRYYKGPFVTGNLQGENAYFRYKEGDVYIGSFNNNKFENGVYTIISTGEYFRGRFKDGNPLHGVWYDKNDNILESF